MLLPSGSVPLYRQVGRALPLWSRHIPTGVIRVADTARAQLGLAFVGKPRLGTTPESLPGSRFRCSRGKPLKGYTLGQQLRETQQSAQRFTCSVTVPGPRTRPNVYAGPPAPRVINLRSRVIVGDVSVGCRASCSVCLSISNAFIL